MNVDFKGRARIFKNERETRSGSLITNYTTSISRKNLDNEWENASIEVKFKRDNTPTFDTYQNYIAIVIDEGFLTFRRYTGNDGKNHNVFYIMILRWHLEEDDLEAESNFAQRRKPTPYDYVADTTSDLKRFDDDDLPF